MQLLWKRVEVSDLIDEQHPEEKAYTYEHRWLQQSRWYTDLGNEIVFAKWTIKASIYQWKDLGCILRWIYQVYSSLYSKKGRRKTKKSRKGWVSRKRIADWPVQQLKPGNRKEASKSQSIKQWSESHRVQESTWGVEEEKGLSEKRFRNSYREAEKHFHRRQQRRIWQHWIQPSSR